MSSFAYALILSFFISGLVITNLGKKKTNFNDLALGEETKAYFAHQSNRDIHFSNMTLVANFVQSIAPAKNKVLCLGNSQTHTINQSKNGEVNYVQMLSDSLGANVEVFAISMHNITLQEMMLSFDYVVSKGKIDYLVLPVFMDDLREDGIRADVFFKNLMQEHYQITDTSEQVARKINREISNHLDIANTDSDIAALKETPQEKVETYLNAKLDDYSQIWKDRAQVRGDFFDFLYISRNTILGIDAQTKRKMIPQRLSDNMDALRYILHKCQVLKIKSIIYIPPIRTDVEPPYDLDEYKNFKVALETEVNKYSGAKFVNLENIVPGQYWGVKNATTIGAKPELDFMHFQYEGHKLLFKYLSLELNKIIAQ